jgi:hypothetical protein
MAHRRGGELPDPTNAHTPQEFVECLRALKIWTGLTYRDIERQARLQGRSLPHSTISSALTRNRLPREELVEALVGACGCDEQETEQWMAVRRNLAIQQEVASTRERPASPAQDTEPGPPEEPPEIGQGRRRSGRWLRPWLVLLICAAIAVALTGSVIAILAGRGDRTSPPTSSPGHKAGSNTDHSNVSLPPGPYQIRSAASGLCLTEQPHSGTGRIYQTSCEHAFPTKTLQAQDDDTYRIEVVHPEFGPACMGIEDARTTPGPHVFDDYCDEGGLAGAAYFHIQRVTRPTSGYLLKPAHNDLCLGFPNNSIENWAVLNQLPCDDHAQGQIFLLDPA